MGDATLAAVSDHSIPHLKSSPDGQSHWLVVHGRPFLILGAELQNSSFSCPEYMQQVWPKLKAFNVNTVLANVSWEAIEPQEGHFEFSRLDQTIHDARHHGHHLILLWFGAFKNGKSTYVPSWVKKDAKRFPRAMLRGPRGQIVITESLSIFSRETVEADAAAFQMLMRHLQEIDEQTSTVIMVQVENEVGLLGDSRDGSPQANECFNQTVPESLTTMLRENWDRLHPSLQKNMSTFKEQVSTPTKLSWPELFGDNARTDEIFMAYHYARFVEEVAAAGKAAHPLPMFVNVWQSYADEDADQSQPSIAGGGDEPGIYPSGGGVINVIDIWQHFAPSLNFIAPDLYLNDYNAVCAKYRHRGQPLFIPEQRRDEYGARRIWSAYGSYGALCASPFGIDTLGADNTTWRSHYGLLAQVSEYVLAVQRQAYDAVGFFFDEVANNQSSDSISVRFGEWNLSIERSFVFGKPSPGYGMVIHIKEACFLLIGEGFQVRFASAKKGARFTGILAFTEKVPIPGTKSFKIGRMLNGDETRSGEQAIMPSTSPDYGDFPICVTIPARTRVAECEVYALF